MLFAKPVLYAIGGVAIAGTLLIGWKPMSSYLQTGARVAGEAARDAVPTGFEIERLQTLIGDLDKVLAEQRARVVRQKVDLDYLDRDTAACAKRVASLSDEVASARQVLMVEQASYVIGGERFDRPRVVKEATAKAEALVRAKAVATAKAQTLTALQRAVGEAEGRIAGAAGQRETYGMRLAQLRANAENVAIRQELAVAIGDLPSGIDAGSFQEVEATFARLEKELEVQSRLMDQALAAPATGAITFAEPDAPRVLAALDAALADPRPISGPAMAIEPTVASAPVFTAP